MVDRLQQLLAMRDKTPDKAIIWYGLAMEYRGRRSFPESLAAFARCRELEPGNVPAYFQAGLTLQEAGRTPEATAMLQEGIKVARQRGDHHAAQEMEGVLESWAEG